MNYSLIDVRPKSGSVGAEIFGVDLNVLEFFEGKKEKVISKLNTFKNNVFVDNEIFNSNGNLKISIKNKKRLIPYITNILNND